MESAILYPWARDEATWDELRYSLRSIERFFGDRDCPIYILSDDRPDWLADGGRVQHLRASKYEEALSIGLQLANRSLWMNDDIYLLARCDWNDFATAAHAGCALAKADGWRGSTMAYRRSFVEIVDRLRAAGIERPLNFSTHTPYLFERAKAQEILKAWGAWNRMPLETIYYNHHRTPRRALGETEKAMRLPDREAKFLNHPSSGPDRSTREGLMDRFPDPAPWELTAANAV